jgi:hypothetical protein
MVRTYEVRESELESLLACLRESDETVELSVDGETLGIIVTPEEYARLRDDQFERDWQTIQRLQDRNADKDPDDVLRVVTAVVEEVRQERYERQQQDSGGR